MSKVKTLGVSTTVAAVLAASLYIATSMWTKYRSPAVKEQQALNQPVISLTSGLSSSWLPNAIEHWNGILPVFHEKILAVFLDYDGTLSPIVNDPSKATLNPAMKESLKRLSQAHQTIIVTGRRMEVIKQFVEMDELYYAASHGFDICGPGGLKLMQIGEDVLPHLQQAFQSLQQALGNIQGCLIEDNRLSVSVHYRNVEPVYFPEIERAVDDIVAMHNTYIVKTIGKMVWEIRPKKDWHKGAAVENLISTIFDDSSSVLPVYIGDDVTDEDAFKTVRSKGGIAILVSQFPRKTNANYFVASPDDVLIVLEKLQGISSTSRSS